MWSMGHEKCVADPHAIWIVACLLVLLALVSGP